MFEGSTIERSARNLMKLQKKILGSKNSCVYRGKKKKINGDKSEIKALFNEEKQKTR
jgi:hypothetical protein